jgi:hypothetical protein
MLTTLGLTAVTATLVFNVGLIAHLWRASRKQGNKVDDD